MRMTGTAKFDPVQISPDLRCRIDLALTEATPNQTGLLARPDEDQLLLDQLSAVPEAEQCGWLKDRYGLA